jgi:ArsR family transcriptional regulator
MTRSTDPDIRLLAALADPVRLAIVRQLAADREVCACDFTSCCDVSQPTVSHHLRVLREAGVVQSERQGNWIYYRLDPTVRDRLTAIAAMLVPAGPIPAAELMRVREERTPKAPASGTPAASGAGA